MGVVIESEVWEPNQSVYIFIFISCFLSLFLLPYVSSVRTPNVFDLSSSFLFLRFQRNFLLLYSLSAVMEGVWSVFGEFELALHGVSREQLVAFLSVGFFAAFVLGPFLGILSDVIIVYHMLYEEVLDVQAQMERVLVLGQRKASIIFFMLHLFVGVWKRITMQPSAWVANICLSLATSIYAFSFETWMVIEHEKQGHRQDGLSEMFWLMTFFESASLIGSQVLVNWLIGVDAKSISNSSTAAILLAIVGAICIKKGWTDNSQAASFKEYRASFYTYVIGDRRIWLLALAQSCVHFAVTVFWILWAPTVVADGREVHLGLIYPCFLGARMLGSTAFPWFATGPMAFRAEDCLSCVFGVMGIAFSIVAYDYQEIGVLVMLFCIFQMCLGLVLPLLARMRTMYVPNELRGGMISLSLVPANAATFFFLVQDGYYRNIGNATIMGFAALGLIGAAGCMYLLKRLGKQPHQNSHKL
ncbi:Molybdate-anion transporter [Dillenia turbinata]|uniref:Molybdate-anion transporter n=1 Tax=Dillenia turbinata TaxID=194707 RepID=A0AAN8UWD8_9MAGN